MPLLTTLIDDKSPLISYDTTWFPGTSQDDSFAIDYYLGTHQKNNAAEGTATFNFNGTAFWIYGANRPSHGTYTIQVNNSNFPNINGAGNYLFQQLLFSMNVSQGMHIVKLINTGGINGSYVDIDMIVWQSEVGNIGDQLVPELVQDVDPRFQYQQSTWQTASASSNLNLNLFNNGTGHVTETSDATVSFTFIVCEAVTLFGTSGPSNGPYSVQLDGGQAVPYNASNAYPTNYGVVIYHADNLGPDEHQLLLTNLPETSGQYLTIDYAQLWSVTKYFIDASIISASRAKAGRLFISSSSSSSTSPSVTPCTPSSINNVSNNKISPGAIAGLVIEGLVALLAAAAAVLFYWRWKAASASPTSYYTPSFRSPETTTATGIAPSLDRSNPSSRQNNSSFQPFAVVGRSLDGNSAVQDNTSSHAVSHSLHSRAVAEVAGSAGRAASNLKGQTAGRRPLPDTPVGQPQPSAVLVGLIRGDDGILVSDSPPGYDTAVGHV